MRGAVVVNLDYTLFIQIANFLILIVLLNLLLYKPILGVIDKRKRQLSFSDEEIRRLKAAMEEKMASYGQKLQAAKQEALRQKNDLVREANDQAKGIVDAVRGEIPQLLETFHAQVQQEVAQAKEVLESQGQRIAREIAEKVLGRGLQ